MEEWQQLIGTACRHNYNGQEQQAQQFYRKALDLAERQLLLLDDHQKAVAAFVASHQQLADFYRQTQQHYEAHLHLKTAHQGLVSLARNYNCSVELRRTARHYSNTSYIRLKQFCQQFHLPSP